MMVFRWTVALTFIVSVTTGCGVRHPPLVPERPPTDPDVEPDADPPSPPPSGPRALARPATFATLVAAVGTLDENGLSDSTGECLLRRPSRPGWPWMLGADLAVAVRPLPEPPEDLDERLIDSPSPILAITRWGQFGSRSYEVVIAVFTNAPQLPDRDAAVVIVTNRGSYLRLTGGLVSAGRTRPRDLDVLEREIGENLEAGALIYVTAEADIELERLGEVLARFPESSPIAFGVALAEGIRVPEPPLPPTDRATGLCPEGLPPAGGDGVRGQLEAALIIGALGPLRVAVRACMTEISGASAAGGRVELMMRIGTDGAVAEACLRSDEVGGSDLRDCLIRAARTTRFPRPNPAGVVDVSLPLRLQPSYQRGVCSGE